MECVICDDEAALWVSERYSDGAGGAVERLDPVCGECVDDVEPEGLDGLYGRYEFKIEPIPEAFGMGRVVNE